MTEPNVAHLLQFCLEKNMKYGGPEKGRFYPPLRVETFRHVTQAWQLHGTEALRDSRSFPLRSV